MAYKVPFVNARKHYADLKPEIDAAIIDCLTKGDLISRGQLEDFEQQLAEFVGVKYAVGLNSGYHALHFALLAAGIGPGDEVIIIHCGAKPVLIEVRDDYNMNPGQIEAAITPRTKALLPVHLNGRMSEMDRIMEIAERHKLLVIEDSAQALGGSYKGKRGGAWGLAGCFSFYPFKILGGFGDGGALTTNDPVVARVATLLRYNGEDRHTGEYYYHGYTALLDNVQAAVLSVKLRYLPKWIEHRRKIAELYRQGLSGIFGLGLPHFSEDHYYDNFQNYVIRTKQRDDLRAYLKDNGVETLIHWPKPMWEHIGLRLENPNLPNTKAICCEVISLPMSAETTPDDVRITCEVIHAFFAQNQ
jgi:dTDP-4-amino-4,6-dideoxygalactose transaminase